MKRLLNFLKELLRIKSTFKSFKDTGINLNSKIIVFNTIRCFSLNMYQELFFAYLFAKSGAVVKILLDDKMLKHWDTIQIHHTGIALTAHKEKFIMRYYYIIQKHLLLWAHNHKNIEVIYYSKLYLKNKVNVEYSQLDKHQAESSVRRYFENGVMNLEDEAQKKYYEDSLYNCMVSRNIAEQIKKELKPDLFITTHGIYSLWGPAFQYLKNNGVPSLVYGAQAYMPRTIHVSDVFLQVLSDDSSWKEFEKTHELDEEKEKKIKAYFDKRINLKAIDSKIYYDDINKFKTINVKRNDNLNFCLFPNIIWDGDIYERDTIFSGIIDWIEQTVNVFRKSPHNLIIRIHPAEANLWKECVSLQSILEERINDLYDLNNVYLIPSTEKINVYDFVLKNIDVGLIYGGIMAMELPYIGIPMISCSKSRNTGAGFTFEPKTINEYTNYLLKPEELIADFKNNNNLYINNLLLYSYWYFFISGYHMPIFNKKKHLVIDYSELTPDDINPQKNNDLKRTLEKFISFMNVSK